MNTSAYVFSLIVKRIKTTALKKYKVRRDTNDQIQKFIYRWSEQLVKISNQGKIESQKPYAHLSKYWNN